MPVQQEEIPRVPVVCTGNDFSTLYAPLIRDGRMEKFYWAPTREDRIGVAMGIFQVHTHTPLPAYLGLFLCPEPRCCSSQFAVTRSEFHIPQLVGQFVGWEFL
jgi:hypothetical protein